MEDRTIVIADKDVAYRGRMANFFRKAGYHVEVTGSADHVLHCIQGQAPVLLLGSEFGHQVASEDLVHLLKKCNSQLQIIMVSDEMSLDQERRVRQEGIFYHALKPATLGEAKELEQAVACAFEKHSSRVLRHNAPAALHHGVAKASNRVRLINALPWLVSMVALILGTNYVSLSAATRSQDGNGLAVWLFLGFCALVVTGQMLPIFRVKLSLGRVEQRQSAREEAARGDK